MNDLKKKSEVPEEVYNNNLDILQNEDKMKAFAEKLIEAKVIPSTYDTPENAVIALRQAKELSIPPMTMLQHSYIVEGTGKIGFDIHLFGLLAKENDVTWTLKHDYVYRLNDGRYVETLPQDIRDEISSIKKEAEDNGKSEDEIKSIVTKKKKKYINAIVTEITFIENFHGEILKKPFKYSWNDAVKAGLTAKFNWKKMPALMMRTRCLVQGLRFYYPELFKGVYERTELLDMKNKEYQVNDQNGFAEVKEEETNNNNQ